MTKLTRRDFVQLAASASVLAGLPNSVFGGGRGGRLLLLIDLKGGNDGLNTLVPHQEPVYHALRPRIALEPSEVIDLGGGFGHHPSLRPFQPLWEQGAMAWVHGLGYAPPNRSHFRSIEIWETASVTRQKEDTGWLARVLPADLPLQGIALDGDAGPLEGAPNVLQMDNLEVFLRLGQRIRRIAATTDNPALRHVLKIRNEVNRNAMKLAETLHRVSIPADAFPRTTFSRRLMTAARIVASGLRVPVIKVHLGGFDTHVNQKPRHARRLRVLAEGLRAFADYMQRIGRWNDVLIVSYSEFGRRVAENANRGTDHGTAAPHFLIGGRVKGGFHGTPPDLNRLDRNDLIHTTDFRALYHTIATGWLRANDSPWAKYGRLDVIA